MISIEKWKILTPIQKLPKNVGNLGKIIISTGFEKLPKVHKIAQSDHTGWFTPFLIEWHAVLKTGKFLEKTAIFCLLPSKI